MTFLLEANEKKYILRQKIGEGAICQCFLGEALHEETPDNYAIKIIAQKYYQFYKNEICFLSKLKDNNNIIKLYEYGQGVLSSLIDNDSNEKNDEKNGKSVYYQVMEYAENGELKDYITGTTSRIPEKISAKIFIQIANAVKYLHENNIAHCDIKPENILMDKDFIPKINDFGFSQKLDRNEDYLLHKRSGTPRYSSPDVLHAYTKGYDGRKNDIFSLGVLLFVITIGDFPFNSPTYSDDKYKFIIKKKYDRFWEYFNYIEISDEFKDLINKLICSNPAKRLSIDEILTHPWLIKQLGINYDEIYNNIIKNDFMSDIFFDKEIIKEMDARKFLK